MFKNRIQYVLIIMFFVLISAPVVKADAPIKFYITTQNAKYEKDYGAYWTDGIKNSPIIKVDRGDTIDIVVAIDSWSDNYDEFTLQNGKSTIKWDCDAFELLSKNGKYHDISNSNFKTIKATSYYSDNPNNYIGGVTYDGTTLNRKYLPYTVEFETSDDIIKKGINKVLQYHFRVKSGISDGIYSIKAVNGDENYVNYNDGWDVGLDDDIIYFQVGESVVYETVDISPSDVSNNTYIIGKYMFTNNVSELYNGVLTTRYIMSASRSFQNGDLENMVIYYKNARGKWIDAINNESIEPPEKFAISYKDMVSIIKKDNSKEKTNSNTEEKKDDELNTCGLVSNAYEIVCPEMKNIKTEVSGDGHLFINDKGELYEYSAIKYSSTGTNCKKVDTNIRFKTAIRNILVGNDGKYYEYRRLENEIIARDYPDMSIKAYEYKNNSFYLGSADEYGTLSAYGYIDGKKIYKITYSNENNNKVSEEPIYTFGDDEKVESIGNYIITNKYIYRYGIVNEDKCHKYADVSCEMGIIKVKNRYECPSDTLYVNYGLFVRNDKIIVNRDYFAGLF